MVPVAGSPRVSVRVAPGQGLRATRIARSAPGAERLQVVAAGERLDHEAGRLGEGPSSSAATRRSGSRADPADRRLARPALLEDRGQVDDAGRRVVLALAGLGHRSARSPGRRGPTRAPAGRRSGRGRRRRAARRRRTARPPGARCAASVRTAAAWSSRVASRNSEFRAMNASRNAPGVRQAEARAGRPRRAGSAARPPARRRRRRRGPGRASPGRGRRR